MKTRLALVAGLLLILFFLFTYTRSVPENTATQTERSSATKSSHASAVRSRLRAAHTTSQEAEPAWAKYQVVAPTPMRLTTKVLVDKKWNDGSEAFSRELGNQAATIGPHAVVYANGNSYVLDTIARRIVGYDKDGKQISSVSLPMELASDLIPSPTDSSLILIDHRHESIYKVDGNEVTQLGYVREMKEYPLHTKFGYDPTQNRLFEENYSGTVDNVDGKLVLDQKSDKPWMIGFDQPVFCVQEIINDGQHLWVLYTLEEDFRVRRLARVDMAKRTFETAKVDVWFDFDGTRRMSATENGVVVIAGDQENGRLISFNYAGQGL